MPNVVETCNTPTSESPFWLITFGFLSTLALRVFVATSGVAIHEYIKNWIRVRTGIELSWSLLYCFCCKKKKFRDESVLKIPKQNDFPPFVQVSLEFDARKCYELNLLSGYYVNVNKTDTKAYVNCI